MLSMTTSPQSQDKEQVLESLRTTVKGLSSDEAQKRLVEYGPNELREKKRRTALQMFLGEFKDVFIILLLVSARALASFHS